MGYKDSMIRELKCDGPGCDKHILYDRAQEQQTFDTPENVWMKSGRLVQSLDGRGLWYCSDACEIKGTGTGVHNLPQQKTIIEAPNSGAVALAAQQAERARKATEAIKAGQEVVLS